MPFKSIVAEILENILREYPKGLTPKQLYEESIRRAEFEAGERWRKFTQLPENEALKKVSGILAMAKRYGRAENREGIYVMIDRHEDLPDVVQKPSKQLRPGGGSAVELSLVRLVPLSRFNSKDVKTLTLSQAPIRVQNVGSLEESVGGITAEMPLGGSLSLFVMKDVTDRVLQQGARAINQQLTITLKPLPNRDLIVNGIQYHRQHPFIMDVPKDHWIVFVPGSESEQSVTLGGQEMELQVCAVYLSPNHRFPEGETLIVPILWNSHWMINGDDGARIDTPNVGFVVPPKHLPNQFRKEYQRMLPPDVKDEQEHAALLAISLPAGQAITWKPV